MPRRDVDVERRSSRRDYATPEPVGVSCRLARDVERKRVEKNNLDRHARRIEAMTYQKPDLFLVGSAQGLVLGAEPDVSLYSDAKLIPDGNHQDDPSVSRDTAD